MKTLSFFDRWLTLWILLAMAAGLALSIAFPGLAASIGQFQAGETSIPLAIGLILMMFPPFAKVHWEDMRSNFSKGKLLTLSLVQNWVVGPILMTLLALVFLHDKPEYLVAVVMVGLARCIAMVVVWNDLARGNRELSVLLVALNALFQVLFYAVYIYLFVTVALTGWGFVKTVGIQVSFVQSAVTVLIYLGIPFAAGLFTRFVLVRWKGPLWYAEKFVPKLSWVTPTFLLATIVVMFALQGSSFFQKPLDVLWIASPLALYFALMWFGTFAVARMIGASFDEAVASAFSAASNDFELAIAVCIAFWGVGSNQAFAAVVGPLIEVPVMVALVKVVQNLRLKEKA